MRTLLLGLSFVMGVLLTVFVVQNTAPVRVNFLGWSTEYAPLAIVILLSALVGGALAALLGLQREIHHRLETRRLKKRMRDLESQLNYIKAVQGKTATTPANPAGTATTTSTTPTTGAR